MMHAFESLVNKVRVLALDALDLVPNGKSFVVIINSYRLTFEAVIYC